MQLVADEMTECQLQALTNVELELVLESLRADGLALRIELIHDSDRNDLRSLLLIDMGLLLTCLELDRANYTSSDINWILLSIDPYITFFCDSNIWNT